MMFRIWTVICVVVGLAGQVSAVDLQEQFERANEMFSRKQYDSAITMYNVILEQGVESSAIYFNLGNAYFKDGDLGHAVLYYLRAKRLNPSDDDIISNLEFAQRFTSIQMEGVRLNPLEVFFDSLVEKYRLNTLAWVSSACFILLFVMLTVRYGLNMRGPLVRSGVVVMLVLLLVAAFLTTVKYHSEYVTERAVVLEEGVVRTGPLEESERELDAAPGLVVEVLSESGDFYNVLFENKRRGWIRKELVAVI